MESGRPTRAPAWCPPRTTRRAACFEFGPGVGSAVVIATSVPVREGVPLVLLRFEAQSFANGVLELKTVFCRGVFGQSFS